MRKLKRWIFMLLLKVGKRHQKKPFDIQIDRQFMSQFARSVALMTPRVKNVTLTQETLAGVPTLKAEGPTRKSVILFCHGGGHFASLKELGPLYHPFAATLAKECHAEVFMPDYRVAPETPPPGGLEDVYKCYLALLERGIKPKDIVLLGDSAGGGLVLSLLLKLRDEGKALPRGAVTLSAFTDLALTGESLESREDPAFSTKSFWELQKSIVEKSHEKDPYISPLYGDYAGLPPMLLMVGGQEKLLDDTLRVAEKAKKAGVDVTLDVNEEMLHVYPVFVGPLEESKDGLAKIARFIEKQRSSKERSS